MKNEQLVSQSFLGKESDAILAGMTAGIVGLGGGGSHVVQQLAHLGVGNFVICDHDIIEWKNLNRLVGGTLADVEVGQQKTAISERIIKGVNPRAVVRACPLHWQKALEDLRSCDVIIGCVDSYRERDELERFARRFLIPYIDLGMDVHDMANGFSVGGQVVLSSPGGPCLRCLGIVSDSRLREESALYGKAGLRPQVVWTNGVLASLAVGLFTQLICPWHDSPQLSACCEFDGNRHKVETNRMDQAGFIQCKHYASDELGDALFCRAT